MAPIKYELRQSTDKDTEHCRFILHSTRPGSGDKFFHLGSIICNFAAAVRFAYELDAVIAVHEPHQAEFARLYNELFRSTSGPTLDDECLDRQT
jgi:hypothetical protein